MADRLANQYQIKDFNWLVNRIFRGILESNAKRVWVLGAGASVDSGIAGATELAHRWSCQIVGQPAPDSKRSREEDLREKIANLKLWRKDSDLQSFAEEIDDILGEKKSSIQHRRINDFLGSRYFDVYDALFSAQPQVGFEHLRREMDDKLPSYGYFALAHLMSSQSNLVVTVNFDSLVSHALFLTGKKLPLILDHESVAHLAKITNETPLICKIHRDLLKDPFSARSDLENLDPRWDEVMNRIFQDYSPIFIGYGANDKTLMESLKKVHSFREPPIWLHYTTSTSHEDIRQEISPTIANFLGNHPNSVLVSYTGFDSLMRYAENVLSFPSVARTFKERTERIYEILNSKDAQAATDLPGQAKSDPIAKASMKAIRRKPKRTVFHWISLAAEEVDLEKRILLFDQAIAEKGNDALLFYHRGMAKNELKRYEDSIQDFDRAIELDPSWVASYFNRGVAKNALGWYEDAIQDFDRAAALDPERSAIYNSRALAKNGLRRFEDAAQDFNEAVRLDPQEAIIHSNIGLSKNDRSMYSEALHDLNRAIELAPQLPNPYCHRAWSKYKLGKYEEAIGDANRALELKPQYARAHVIKALILSQMSKVTEALNSLEKAFEIDPDSLATIESEVVPDSIRNNGRYKLIFDKHLN